MACHSCDAGFVIDDTRTGCVAGKVTPFHECGSRAFLQNGVFKPCSSNCITCTDNTHCVACDDGHVVVERSCIPNSVAHCAVSNGAAYVQCVDRYHVENDACVPNNLVCAHETPSGRVECGDGRLLQTAMNEELSCVTAGETTNCGAKGTCASPSTPHRDRRNWKEFVSKRRVVR